MLLRALVEAEIDGLGVSNQLTALKETVESHFKVNFNNQLEHTEMIRDWMENG